MTRPDARLLVPVSALPGSRAPVGATVWQEHPYRGLSAGVTTYCREDADVYVVWADGRLTYEPASSLHLDLSRPDVVDRVPVRLDALAWALGAIGHRFGEMGLNRVEFEVFPGWEAIHLSRNTETVATIANCPAYGRRRTLDPWPDLTGLDDDHAARAVVAAALRGGA